MTSGRRHLVVARHQTDDPGGAPSCFGLFAGENHDRGGIHAYHNAPFVLCNPASDFNGIPGLDQGQCLGGVRAADPYCSGAVVDREFTVARRGYKADECDIESHTSGQRFDGGDGTVRSARCLGCGR